MLDFLLNLLNSLFTLALVLGIIALILYLASRKWPWLRPLNHGYWWLLTVPLIATARWLWKPMIRRGIGHMAPPHDRDDRP